MLSESPEPYPYPIDSNPALDSIPKVDPGTVPVLLKVSAGVVHDNYYFVKAELDKTTLPLSRGLIQALEWSFAFKAGILVMTIARGLILSNETSADLSLTPLERNSQVVAALVKIKHRYWVRIIREQPLIAASNFEPISNNSALNPTQLAALGPSFLNKVSVPAPDREEAVIEASSPMAGVRDFGVPLVAEPMLLDTPVDIGHGAKNKENAEDFSRIRKKKPPIGTQDDLLQPYQPPPSSRSKEDLLEAAVAEVGLERFPVYALDFLRFYYKL
jgi:hypothetical protein